MKKLKVAVDVHDLLVARTGIKTYILELVSALRESPDHEVHVYPKLENVRSINFFKLNQYGLLRSLVFHLYTLIWKQIILPLNVWSDNIDVLICPDYYAPFWKMKANKIVVFHDAFFWESPQHYNSLWLRYFKSIITMGLRGKAKILTVSSTSKSKLNRYLQPKVPIRYALTSFPHESDAIKQEPIETDPYFLHIGVFEKRKNLPFLIESYALFLQSLSYDEIKPKLILVGSAGPKKDLDDSQEITATIVRHGLEDMVICPGYLPPSAISNYYLHGIAYLFPSTNEGFGLPILEAFFHRLPVVVANQEALMEIGSDAVIVANSSISSEWVDAMSLLYKKEASRQDLIKRGLIRLQDFRRPIFAESLRKIIAE